MLSSFLYPDEIEAGCDEAGRGCYAGPVFAAAVILPVDFDHPLLNDSKQVNEKNRDILRPYIEENALAYGIAMINNEEIDQINILKASFKAMHLALDQLKLRPDRLLIDGNRFVPYQEIPHNCIIKGDGKYKNIAAASILAKTHRDSYMKNLDIEFPMYNWKKNKGYGTLDHRKAIEQFGITSYHRKSFNILPIQTKLF
ncbi:ribonuclease HII [Rhizosphaericola mali]|uniref:Ribonuclease HII n=1 Tax=Rhizosphaericola mali TaxID=2545455 RepID=A0A5P2GBC1_9BACT|nr:ribonuclease HII [Rhizosphaericola mali]QES90513.1 ribonuclease HII [Rhizosphaericola mali]